MNLLRHCRIALTALLAALATNAEARLDLSRASVERLDNGLTLILLEDRTFPVVSIQTVYRTGAKDDPAGRLGLAHFFEHMAFRGSKNFPDNGLVSEIYAAGGEWHGYTWIDLTTYFATAPKENLQLLLDIEADRIARLDLRREDVEAERGAVLAEMNGYLNDPDSTLFDALIATHFLTHPYRNNTIGYAGDINAIAHADIVEFYRRHYAPQNAVIALVGDFDRAEARAAVRKKFGKIKKQVEAKAPLTAEIPRTGERRVRLSLPSDEKLFKIAYPAPAASHPDFPAFLILQALIGRPSGVNFNQNDWGTPVYRGLLDDPKAKAVRTWFIPTAETYATVISGAASPDANETQIENSIQSALDRYARGEFVRPVEDDPAATREIASQFIDIVKTGVFAGLAFDVETTEDAAHQLAFFAGIGALDQFLALESKIRNTTADDIAAVAGKYLRPDLRTIVWLEPGDAHRDTPEKTPEPVEERAGSVGDARPLSAPVKFGSSGAAPILFQPSAFSSTAMVQVVLDGRFKCGLCAVDFPAFNLTTVGMVAAAQSADDLSIFVVNAINAATAADDTLQSSEDPLTRIEEIFSAAYAQPQRPKRALVGVVSGDIGDAAARSLGDELPQGDPAPYSSLSLPGNSTDIDVVLAVRKAQHAVGYMAAAPAAGSPAALATEIALYVLSHGYEGRLGREAISRRGLVYYIDTQYRAGPGGGAVTIAAGVDPGKVDAFRALLKSEIARLRSEPPSEAEIDEARRHLQGRKISAAQSNEEIADALIRDFLATGGPESAVAFAARLDKVSRADVLNAIEALQKGAVVTVRGEGVD